MSKSLIEWTDRVWNFIIGCDKVSKGCENCYAIKEAWIHSFHPNEKISGKFKGTVKKTDGGKLNWTGVINYYEPAMLVPLKVKEPQKWFVNSLSDLFHKDVSLEIIARCWAVMWIADWHIFQVLTKRPDIMLKVLTSEQFYVHLWAAVQDLSGKEMSYEDVFKRMPLQNVWLGTSVEDQKAADERIPLLLQVPAAVRWLSCEPLLGPVDLTCFLPSDEMCSFCGWVPIEGMQEYLNIHGEEADCIRCLRSLPITKTIDWVVAGGESGHKARPTHPDWLRSLRDQCFSNNVPFNFKQWGEYWPGEKGRLYRSPTLDYSDGQPMVRVGKKKAGRLLNGRDWNEYPAHII